VVDADGYVMKPDVKVEDFITKYMPEGIDVLCANDRNTVLNTGVMIIRNTPYTKALLEATWNHVPKEKKFHEQAAMSELYTDDFLGSKSKFSIVGENTRDEIYTFWSNYFPGVSFFMHVARCAFDPAGFMYTLDTYCPIKMDEETSVEYEDRMEWLNNSSRCRESIDKWVSNKPSDSRHSLRSTMFKRHIKHEKLTVEQPY